VSKNIILVRCRSSTVTLSCLPGYNISATVMAIDVKVCTMVELRPGTVFCLLVAISLGVSKCGVRKGARMDRLTTADTDFCYDREYLENGNCRSVTCHELGSNSNDDRPTQWPSLIA